MRVMFLLPLSGYPRCEKRMAILRSLDLETQHVSFSRAAYAGSGGADASDVLASVRDAALIRRCLTYLWVVPRIRRAMTEVDVVYCFGVDLLALARFSALFLRRSPRFVVEVGDIPDGMCSDTIRSRLARFVERLVLSSRRVLLVVTSPSYVDAYYHGIQRLAKLRTFVIENKVDSAALAPAPARERSDRDGPLRIGYFGRLRGKESWETLKRLARAGSGRVQIELRGLPVGEMTQLISEVEEFDNITFGGPYRVPEDLPEMYGGVDLSWLVHYGTLPNWRWARSNRFYEACYFSTPMIGQAGKDDTRLLVEHGLGIDIDVTRPEEAASRLLSITPEDLERWRSKLQALPRDLYVLSDEHDRLVALLDAAW